MSEQKSRELQSITTKKTRMNATQKSFLEDFALHGNITKACKKVNITRTTLYRWKELDEPFLFSYNLALEEAKDAIREEIYRRGKEGWDEEVYQLGKYAGTVRKYDTTLLIFHAKMLMPEYREKQQVEVSGSVDVTGARALFLSKLARLKESE